MKCKEFIQDHVRSADLPKIANNLSDDEWKVIEKLVLILKIPFITTKMLQTTNFTLSDFHAEWLILKNNIKIEADSSDAHNDYAKQFLLSMDKYSGQLLSNPMYVSCVYLDPRFTKTLNLTQKTLAISKLLKVYERIINEENEHFNAVCDNNKTNRLDMLENIIAEECDVVESTIENNTETIHRLLQEFAQLPRERASINILDYWEKNKTSKPELFKLSQIVYAAAPTQTSTESSFSTLGHIFSSRRTKIKDKLLEDILIINLNKDLFYKITGCSEK